MDNKLDRLYDEIMQLYPSASESKRAYFKSWFIKNSMLPFIKTFLDSDLNINHTANTLFLGRSTVIFRLNRIMEFTGYNIRKFNDALNLLKLLSSSELI